jgi:hypothetical protein
MARTAGTKPKRGTVMVYLAGDNNLDSAGVADLEEMKAIGSTDEVTIVAQFDRSGATRTTNRYLLRKKTRRSPKISSPLSARPTREIPPSCATSPAGP